MDMVLFMKSALMGIVEGLTEFLPISSTGHLILADSLLEFARATGSDKAKVFEIAIQTGAIFAVILVYMQRIKDTLAGMFSDPKAQRFTINVLIGFLPAAIMGLAVGKIVKAHLFTPTVVATTFILGGVIILIAERFAAQRPQQRVETVDDMTPMDAIKVGLIQCLALIPGTSRSGSTIIGGMLMGLSRKAATDYSFFLGIPTLVGAGAYSLYKDRALLSADDLPLFSVGLVFAFLSAWICVRWLIRYVSSHNFIPFAWYRIAFGIFILVSANMGWVVWAD
ncbi:MAG: undecaprenyl-diphosphate phosphatase [Aquabacterium sp.]|uniref:undecaprenyl-diphosphate phosphatase n=1 Tax=Aquabacterium sp. TaxID=1872578 RepID=UPI001201F701|nr:undecaprenyl-diphosphate phosphatase [Aquabacterium sp.]TAK97145.1 MAG: undecaprenyl-diphosphate phosphatase [Aquabacterium sp.]